jgi:hypothetical protein
MEARGLSAAARKSSSGFSQYWISAPPPLSLSLSLVAGLVPLASRPNLIFLKAHFPFFYTFGYGEVISKYGYI